MILALVALNVLTYNAFPGNSAMAHRWNEPIAVRAQIPWSFRPLLRAPIPKVTRGSSTHPVDAFLNHTLRKSGLKMSPPADKVTLIRRLTLDLHGVLPTPAEVDTFVKEDRPGSYQRLVDRLLASPKYGERWARHWLDLVRYAESEGFKSDEPRPNAWRYRDYVIRSLNADKPYDRFVKEQLAGDELYPDDPDARIATGFLRHWADESNARNLRLRRQEILNDVTDVTAGTLLALTFGCARCHDHKTDPVSQKDYYRFQAFFAAIRPRDDIPALSDELFAQHQKQAAKWDAETQDIRAALDQLESTPRQKVYLDKKRKFPEEIQAAIDTPADRRTSLQWLLVRKAEPQLLVSQAETLGAMKPDAKSQWEALNKQLEPFKKSRPDPLPTCIGVTDIGNQAPPVNVLAVGVYDAPKEVVQPGFPSVLAPTALTIQPLIRKETASLPEVLGPGSTGRRSALAAWIVDPANPLTARVIVNRVWQQHFGRGIVNTPSDFGLTGETPTHPELLDWLSNELIRGGWSLKRLHRLILTSYAYQQASISNRTSVKVDPENRMLWRYSRPRLQGEALRDCMLQASGILNEKMGGPGVMPELPEGITTRGGWKEAADPAERNRRSIYVSVKRNLRYPFFALFDQPDTHEPCARRETTTTGLQALTLLNDGLVRKCAAALADRVRRETGSVPTDQVTLAYRLALCRRPTSEEMSEAMQFLSLNRDSLVDLCHSLFACSEFMYIE